MEITAYAPRGLVFRRISRKVFGWIHTYQRHHAGARADRHLHVEADDRQLADIGLSRDDVRLERIIRSGCPRP